VSAVTALGKALRRLTASSTDLEREDQRRVSASAGGTPIVACRDRSEVVVVGEVRGLKLEPRGSSRWFEVTLDDGSDTVTLIWMGRRTIAGIEPGARLRVTGRITRTAEGERVFYNPRYELLKA